VIEDGLVGSSDEVIFAYTAAFRKDIAVLQGEIAEYCKTVSAPGNASLRLTRGTADNHRAPLAIITKLLEDVRIAINHKVKKLKDKYDFKIKKTDYQPYVLGFDPGSLEICFDFPEPTLKPGQEELPVANSLGLEAFIAILDTVEAIAQEEWDKIEDEELFEDVCTLTKLIDDAGYNLSLRQTAGGHPTKDVVIDETFTEKITNRPVVEERVGSESFTGELTLVDLEEKKIGIKPYNSQERIKCVFTEQAGFTPDMLGKDVVVEGKVTYPRKTGKRKSVVADSIVLVQK
jgi:predicted RNA-binding protein